MDTSQQLQCKDKPVVAVWRNDLLPLSETFIAEQARHLQTYRPIFVGRRVVNKDAFDLKDVIAIRDLAPMRGLLEAPWYSITRRSMLLTEHLKKAQPRIIHAHFGTQAIYALPYKRLLNVPLVTTFHGQDATRSAKSIATDRHLGWVLFNRYLQDLQVHGDRFLAVSHFIKDRLIERGFPAERIVVHHIGIDVDRFNFRDLALRRGRGLIITVCRLVDKKGTEFLIRALPVLAKQVPDVELRIVGDGPLRESLENLAIELNVRGRVHFLGSLPHHQIQAELADADVFALPSVTAADGSTEGLPISILEAMASGVPVVSTYHSGIPEAVADGETGMLVPERDVEQLASALERLTLDVALAKRVTVDARTRVESQFAIGTQTRKLECIYDQVLEGR